MLDEREAFGRGRPLVLVERFGRWSARRKVRQRLGSLRGLRVGDFGCGYEATLVCERLDEVAHATVIDLQLAPHLATDPRVTAIEGELPSALGEIEDGSLDVVLLVSVLEHVWDHVQLVAECRRVLAPGGVLYVHVPSWRGKFFLEVAAFRFGWSTEGIDDHKRYYDPRDLWPVLRAAGFAPSAITCRHQLFGCATYARCRA
jgi:SAM-dependent methyltransferase